MEQPTVPSVPLCTRVRADSGSKTPLLSLCLSCLPRKRPVSGRKRTRQLETFNQDGRRCSGATDQRWQEQEGKLRRGVPPKDFSTLLEQAPQPLDIFLVPLSTIFLPRNFLQASIKASTWGTLGDFLCHYKPPLTIFLNPQIPITPSTAQ